ncbi:MAG: DNA topoisomerase III [Bacillota bacterium]
MKSVILTEKPSVARDLAGVLGQFRKGDGYLENNRYIITWAIGHLVSLANPEDYDPVLKKWDLSTLPILPDHFKLKPSQKTLKQFKVVKELFKLPDITELINACDAGREGELIFRYIYHLSGCKKPFMRLWLSETTAAAVKKAFSSLRPGHELDNLAAAAQARSQADWLIGINATRAFTVKHNNLLSVGRVQTPTLVLIVNREREISNFTPTAYWELHAEFTGTGERSYVGKWFRGKLARFDKPEDAAAVQNKVAGQPGKILQVEEKEITEQPPLLFNLNDLQKEANRKFGLPAATTLAVAQTLYESKKLLTYPRTDSRHLTKELAGTIPARLAALSGVHDYAQFVTVARRAGTLGKRYVDDGRVSDHTALIPTDLKPDLDRLSTDERRIYDLVVRRFLTAFFPAARYRQTRVITEAAGETFATTGKVQLENGWKAIYNPVDDNKDNGDDEQNLPTLVQGETVQTTKTEVLEKETKPPKRYTEASLLAVMEGAGRLLDDQELKDAMKGHGLGTPATRAAIIERLLQVGYIERKQKTLVPTTKGESLIDLVPDIIKSPEMTGQWEQTLADIEAGTARADEFMAGIIKLTRQIVELARSQQSSNQVVTTREALGKCPLCGRDIVEYPKSYSCSGYREGCKMTIWKKIAGKKITAKQAQTLLLKGKTAVLKGFKSNAGKEFQAALALGQDGKVNFEFTRR